MFMTVSALITITWQPVSNQNTKQQFASNNEAAADFVASLAANDELVRTILLDSGFLFASSIFSLWIMAIDIFT